MHNSSELDHLAFQEKRVIFSNNQNVTVIVKIYTVNGYKTSIEDYLLSK